MRMNSLFVPVCCAVLVFCFAGAEASGEDDTLFEYSYPAQGEDLGFYKVEEGPDRYESAKKGKVRNVIVCIGDGMGVGQVSLSRLRGCGVDGRLTMERFPVGGQMRTHSASSLVTDSAAAATALACGIKTKNGSLGQDVNGVRYQSVLERCAERGMRTGLVVTCTMSHATPAGFGSHVSSRGMQDVIAGQLLENRIDVLFGGGREYFLPQATEGSKRKDDMNLLQKAKEYGYAFAETKEQMEALKGRKALGLFAMGAMTTQAPEPMLGDMTRKAIELLSAEKKGFFLMVEGSQIDWACHSNDAETMVRQTLLFDLAVREAAEFARKDGHTLVVVTADHETGGLIQMGIEKEGGIAVKWSTKGHSGMPVPVFAYGPGAERFSGMLDNTEIPRKIAELLKIGEFPRVLP